MFPLSVRNISGTHTNLRSNEYCRPYFAVIKEQGRKTDRLLAFSADVKNGGTIAALGHTPAWRGA
jgi:hypothetical protein